MALSAADLQRRHNLEGAPDPFPSLPYDSPAKPKSRPSKESTPDTDSELAFPSLASTTPQPTAAVKSAWSSAGPRIKPVVAAPVFVDSFTLTALDLSNTGRDGKALSLGEVMKQVMAKYKVKIDASANQRARQTTFHLKAESQKELDKAKRSLLALLSPVVKLVINAPASVIPKIIGAKGAALKEIRDKYSVRVDIPKRETIVPSPDLEEGQEPTVPVTLEGPQPLAYEAQAIIQAVIQSNPSRTSQRVRDIHAHILPFLIPRRVEFLAAAPQGTDVSLALNQPAREITASGDRDAVTPVVEAIKASIDAFTTSLTSVKISLPKRQHRLLVGLAVEQVMAKSRCAVTVPTPEDPSDDVTVWGKATDLPAGLGAVMEQANSKYIHEYPLPGPVALSKQLVTYMAHINLVKTLQAAHVNVQVFLPSTDSQKQSLSVDIVGDKSETDLVVSKLSELIGKLIGATRSVTIDWLLHRMILLGKNGKKIKQYHDVHNVQVFFPAESAESSSVLLVYDPFGPAASPNPAEKKSHLDEVEKDLLKLAKDAADVKTSTLSVEKKWHSAIVGYGGTTLNAIIGEDKTLSIKLGADAAGDSEDIIVIRGVSADVDRVVKEITQIVEDAKNDQILSSYSTEFDIEKEYVGRIVGAHGAGVNKLRDQLGVKVDVSDDSDDKKKRTHKSRVTITGRKENVEEAKKRILAHIERLADETSEVLKIPAQYHASLIGQSGKYATRLEEKYSVKITFPRSGPDSGEGRTREPLKPDEVLLKGGKKGVAGAKSELLDALEYERENNNILKFTIPTRAVARVLGRGGASINEIKDETNVQIDVEKASEEAGAASGITLRGTKAAIAQAKKAILAIADQVTEETTITISIESRFHRSIIGAGGQGLKELIAKCDGPSDPKVQAGLIRFPRQGEPGDEVRLRGEPKLVAKLKDELEKRTALMRDRIIHGVSIPTAQHRAIIGRGGQNLNELQDKYSVQIQIPGSRSYGQIGAPENTDELEGVDAATLVKVTGSRAGVEACIAALKASVKPPPPAAVMRDITVPLKYHAAISQQGTFFRTLRSHGVTVDHSAMPSKSSSPPPHADESARIDDDEAANGETAEHTWRIGANYAGVDEGDAVWTFKGKDTESLDKAEKLFNKALEAAQRKTHVGHLTLADRSSFPRIVGTKGANVARLRDESGADIQVGRDDNLIVIVGSEQEVNDAKKAILELASSPARGYGGRRGDRDRD